MMRFCRDGSRIAGFGWRQFGAKSLRCLQISVHPCTVSACHPVRPTPWRQYLSRCFPGMMSLAADIGTVGAGSGLDSESAATGVCHGTNPAYSPLRSSHPVLLQEYNFI